MTGHHGYLAPVLVVVLVMAAVCVVIVPLWIVVAAIGLMFAILIALVVLDALMVGHDVEHADRPHVGGDR